MSLKDWDVVVLDLAYAIWVDFLGWCVGHSSIATPLRELVPHAVARRCAHSGPPDQQADAAWFDTEPSPEQRARLAQSIGAVSLEEIDQLLSSLLSRYPNRQLQRLSAYRRFRQELIEDALGTALEALPEFPFEDWRALYFDQLTTRAVEDRETRRLLDLAVEREYEVIFPLLGELPGPLSATDHGLVITSDPPANTLILTRPGRVYACVAHIVARGPSDAIAQARRKVETFLAAAGVRSGFGVNIDPLGASPLS